MFRRGKKISLFRLYLLAGKGSIIGMKVSWNIKRLETVTHRKAGTMRYKIRTNTLEPKYHSGIDYTFRLLHERYEGFLCSSVGKSSVGDLDSIPGSGGSPGEGNGNPLQYSCLENPMDSGDWQATVHGLVRVRHDLMLSFFFL